jgi:hypothetical protein
MISQWHINGRLAISMGSGCSQIGAGAVTVTLISRNAYGDLFLRDEQGKVFWLDVANGSLSQIASSESQFLV